MLTIRLAGIGRSKLPLYRIVLTEHTKPIKSGYHDVLGTYDPIKKIVDVDIEKVHYWISQGAGMSSRAAKVIYKETASEEVKKIIVYKDRERKPKNEAK